MKSFLIYLPFVFLVVCCEKKKTEDYSERSPRIKKVVKILAPKNGTRIKSGEVLNLVFSPSDSIQSITIPKLNLTFQDNVDTLRISTRDLPVGQQSLQVKINLGNKTEAHFISLLITSDVIPKEYGYSIIRKYVHDPDAYTQGLLFYNDTLYEGTGTWDNSDLRKVDLNTGKVLKSVPTGNRVFGEGIAIWNERVYQLTWQSRKGFVYDLDFKKIDEFNYSTEGWGLTTMGDTLVMSDGTNKLYLIDPKSYGLLDTRQVYAEDRPIDSINELEFIDGQLFANIYMTDFILIIDPKSGKVTGKIDLNGIFNKDNYKRRIDVLNGIAYQAKTGSLFVTGKYWPKLFEIQIFEKKDPS